ncbi:MAG TPA: IS110 family transposase [Gammaproteobacteria bacterium]|nr:IS110 family transposase [Gammaproteobacteria bacterium]
MNYDYYLGIDMSKLSFDYCLMDGKGMVLKQGDLLNQEESIKDWIRELGYELGESNFWKKTLVCMEHSGYYGAPLLRQFSKETQTNIWIENALQIKRSMGLQRGKSDRVDANRIASYCLDFRRKARIWQPTRSNIERLGLLLSHRDRMVKNLMSLRNTVKEEEGYVSEKLHEEMKELNRRAIEAMEESVEEFDARIEELLQSDTELAELTKIIKSIPGFGPVIAPKIIEVTRGFTRLTDPRSFACYAGVAPFEHSSGTSIRGKTRVSHLANKDIKKMLHLAALVTIRKGNIMHEYFQRKVAEGKNKMSIINAVRNKLIHILFACVRNHTTYQKNYHHSLA